MAACALLILDAAASSFLLASRASSSSSPSMSIATGSSPRARRFRCKSSRDGHTGDVFECSTAISSVIKESSAGLIPSSVFSSSVVSSARASSMPSSSSSSRFLSSSCTDLSGDSEFAFLLTSVGKAIVSLVSKITRGPLCTRRWFSRRPRAPPASKVFDILRKSGSTSYSRSTAPWNVMLERFDSRKVDIDVLPPLRRVSRLSSASLAAPTRVRLTFSSILKVSWCVESTRFS
mmetsp:Transcript_2635/g.6164  ORF Transcript_2635/g.6164 Transcript_2635/m.6164 type:complete len:234 (+) Transcript_2635:1326-2027(+)